MKVRTNSVNSLFPISKRCNETRRFIVFGKLPKQLSRNSSIRKLTSLPKFAGKNSRYTSFRYNSVNDGRLMILSGSLSNGFTLIFNFVRFVQLRMLSGNVFKPKTSCLNNSFRELECNITVSAYIEFM